MADKYLTDKDIEKLKLKQGIQKYEEVIGEPKELYLYVYESGKKTFFIKLKNGSRIKRKVIGEYRKGIFSVKEARTKATQILKELNSGKTIETLDNVYTFGSLFEKWLDIKKHQVTPNYLQKIINRNTLYTLSKLKNIDVKEINYIMLKDLLTPIYNPNNPNETRLDTIQRLIGDIRNTLNIAVKNRYIDYNPADYLKGDFLTPYEFAKKNSIDTRLPALTDEAMIKEFIRDLKKDNKMALATKRACYIQILSANRPANTASAKWEDIDLDNGIWTIKSDDMKMREEHIIILSEQMIKVFKEQREYSPINSPYVFPSIETATGHIHRDTINKAMKNCGGKEKWKGRLTAHGFRATFRTFCTINLPKLYEMGVSEKTIEANLAHRKGANDDKIVEAYQRQMANHDQKQTLTQWWADYLDSIESLF